MKFQTKNIFHALKLFGAYFELIHVKVADFLYNWWEFLVAELYKMVCEPDETDLNIHIPVVMLPQDAGIKLEKMLSNGSSG